MLRRFVLSTVAVLLLITAAACEKEKSAPAVSTDVLPSGLIVAAAPADARGVAEVRKSAKDGEQVVIRGVIAGRADPIAENRAVFTLLDGSIRTCNQVPGDSCATPWDACCEPADVIAAHSATVQVVNPEGKPLKIGLKSAGLAPLTRVIVVGEYKTIDSQAATIHARSLFVEK